MLLTGVSQVRSSLICTPRYLALSTDSKVWPCSVYWEKMGCLDLFMLSTWHLLELNSMSKVRSQICNLSSSSEVTGGGGGWVGANGLIFWLCSVYPCREAGLGGFLGCAAASCGTWGRPPQSSPTLGHAEEEGQRAPPVALRGSLGRPMAHPSGAPLRPHRRPPGSCGGPTATPPLASPRERAMAHPSGAHLRSHRRPPWAYGGPTATPPSGAPPRQGYGTPLRRAPPPT